MNLKIKSKELVETLQLVNSIASEKAIKEILKNILLEIEDDNIIFSATDLEVFIRKIIKIDEKISSPPIAFNGKILFDLIKEITNEIEEVNISFENNKLSLNITDIGLNSYLNYIDGESFPKKFDISEENYIELELSQLQDYFKKCYFATGIDPSRKFVEGVLCEFFGDEIRFVATDSNRLILITDHLENIKSENKISLLFPKRIPVEILKCNASENNKRVRIYWNLEEKKALLRIGSNIEIYTRLIDANYPDYMRVIPSSYNYSLEIEKTKLLNIISLVSIFSEEKSNPQIYLTLKDNEAIFEAKSENEGYISKKYKTNQIYENEFKISFNGRHFRECIKEIDDENLILTFIDKKKPIKIKPIDNDNHIIIIMPMML
ncbi:MAG TPA: DNA polymerase III subunit beta [bacterium]|nr:DNA polymerase III subunit beta [bacterium]HOL46566.1 DNA polymerase III subunit beta [bacterium]HPQ17863.1 DNA polymerase III subunit beta [bacterium]